jgi:glycosyltransferase involved in cell wall biosynthesis
MKILLVPNDPLSAYLDLDRWYDRPNGYVERGHEVVIFPTGELQVEAMPDVIKKYGVDVIRILEGGRWYLSAAAAWASSKTGVPFIPSVHGELEEIAKIRGYSPDELNQMRRMRRAAQDNAYKLLLVQKSWMHYFAETKYADKVVFFPNYVQLDKFDVEAEPKERVLYLGRLDADKDIKTILGVADNTDPKYGLEFLFVGKGNMAEFIKNHGHSHINGVPHTEVPQVMAESKIVLCAYNGTSGFGMPVMEAQSARRPVVVSRKGWAKDFVEKFIPDEDVSYFMDPGYHVDCTKCVIDKIEIIMDDPGEWARLSKEGRTRMEENFDRDMILDKEVKIIEEAVG